MWLTSFFTASKSQPHFVHLVWRKFLMVFQTKHKTRRFSIGHLDTANLLLSNSYSIIFGIHNASSNEEKNGTFSNNYPYIKYIQCPIINGYLVQSVDVHAICSTLFLLAFILLPPTSHRDTAAGSTIAIPRKYHTFLLFTFFTMRY